jgi:UDP:flavonoid glycosyltransferase YjiC (YdhE family)
VKGVLGIGIIPICLSSIDTAPFGHLLLPDSSPEGRKRNVGYNKHEREVTYGSAQRRFREVLNELGANSTDVFMRDANYLLTHRFVQMCAPSFEYIRSDAPNSIVFAGGLPPGLRDPWLELPAWWGDILRKGEKKVVFVAQGTISMNPNDLIVPTMIALRDKQYLILVVALGKKGASLPADMHIPGNVRVADFVPYDEMLEYTDVFVSNAGYGAVQHGLSNGVPQVVAGISADKGENAMRVEWSGVGVNLRTDRPSAPAVERAVMKVLENKKYSERAKEIQVEMQGYDPIGVVIENIEAVAR